MDDDYDHYGGNFTSRHEEVNLDKLPNIIEYCKKENLAFTDSEKLQYNIAQTKKNHRMYTNALKHCFRSNTLNEEEEAMRKLANID